MSNFEQQLEKIKSAPGFIAALDQSGGSTPKALGLYGIADDARSNDEEVFDIVRQMRTGIITSAAFNGERILGAIPFYKTMDREAEEQPTASYHWELKNVVPFLKVDKGLADAINGAQVMNPMPNREKLIDESNAELFGTKMRSVVNQRFEIKRPIIAADLVPLIEPKVDIHCPHETGVEDTRFATAPPTHNIGE